MIEFQIILQARMGSTRLPGKVMLDLLEKPMLLWQVESLRSLSVPIVIATTLNERDDCIEDFARKYDLLFIRGSENNVYERFKKVQEKFPAKNHIRITGDCPLVSPKIISQIMLLHEATHADYSSNTLVRSFPDGLDVEVFSQQAFSRLESMKLTDYQMEHVLPGIYQNPREFQLTNLLEERNLGHWRWTIDYSSDFVWLQSILMAMKATEIPEYEDILNFISEYPVFMRIQKDVTDA